MESMRILMHRTAPSTSAQQQACHRCQKAACGITKLPQAVHNKHSAARAAESATRSATQSTITAQNRCLLLVMLLHGSVMKPHALLYRPHTAQPEFLAQLFALAPNNPGIKMEPWQGLSPLH